MSLKKSNIPDKFEDYGDLGYLDEMRKRTDERNSHELMRAKFQEISDIQKYIEESKKANRLSLTVSIISIIIAIISLIGKFI